MARLYLVDGYNVIYARNPRPESLEAEREHLVRQVRRALGSRVLVVFDGQHGVGGRGEAGVVYTRGETADEYIRRYVARSDRPQDIVVVTRDRPLQNSVKHFGARVMDPARFLQEIRRAPAGSETPETRGEKALKPQEVSRINRELLDLWSSEGPEGQS